MSVYFAKVGPYWKIGYSANPERRVRRLFSSATVAPEGTPRGVADRRLVRVIDGDWDAEQCIHQALRDFALMNEWYLDEPEVRDFIATVEPGAAPAHVERPAGTYEPPYDEAGEALCASVIGQLFRKPAA